MRVPVAVAQVPVCWSVSVSYPAGQAGVAAG
jgi:hypothetical protein